MKKRQFLKLPEYPGGKLAYQRYIVDNLIYPKEALQHSIEGIVQCSADVDDNGKVLNVKVDKGIGFGCDEEAVRLLNGMHFGGVTNRGVRLKSRKKFKIRFRLKADNEIRTDGKGRPLKWRYSFKASENKPVVSQKESSDSEKRKEGKSTVIYSYTIRIGNPSGPSV